MSSTSEVTADASSGYADSLAVGSPVDVLRAEVQQFLSALTGEKANYFPNGGNAGDALIATGTYHCFERLGLKYESLGPTAPASTGTIIFAGGGNLIQRYDFIRGGLLRHLNSADRIIVLPHTIRSNEDLLAKMDGRVTLFCREVASYLHCKKHAVRANVFLGHDMAFHADVTRILGDGDMRERYQAAFDKKISEYPKYCSKIKEREIVYFLRFDCEKSNYKMDSDMDVSHVFMGTLARRESVDQSVWCLLEAIARCAGVVTDRLHVAMAAALLGVPCQLFDNNYGKNSDMYRFSLEGRFPRIVFKTDISILTNTPTVAKMHPVTSPRPPFTEKKLALLYCVTGQPHLQERLEGAIADQRQLESHTGIRCPYARVLVTDRPVAELSATVRGFFDHFACDVDAFVQDPYVDKRYFSLAKMRNAALRYAAQSGFEWVLLCDSDTIFADYRLEPPDTGFGVPEVYWQKASEDVMLSLEKVQKPDQNTFAKGNSWFLISSRVFQDVAFNENIYGYGFEDMEYEARARAKGAKNTTTALRVIHRFHPEGQRAIDQYCHVRNSTIFEYVRDEVKAGRTVDATRPLRAFPAKHKDWSGALILFSDSNTVLQWNQLTKGKYKLDGNILRVEWDRFPPESFELKGGVFVALERS